MDSTRTDDPKASAAALRRAAIDGDVDQGLLMAGQSVGMVVAEQSMAEIMDELIEQTVAALARQSPPSLRALSVS